MHVPPVALSLAVTTDGRIVRADDALVALLGVPIADLIGRRLASLAHELTDAADIVAAIAAGAEGRAGQAGAALRTAVGDQRHVQLVTTRSGRDEITVIVIDETERVLAERDLAHSQRRWLSLVRNAADIVFTTAPDGALTSVTSALPHRLGWAVEDVIGRRGLGFVHRDDRPAADAAWLAVSSRHSTQERLDARLVHADGTESWARIVVSDLRDDPDVQSIVGNVTDITEQKLAEAHRRHEELRFRTRFEQSLLPQSMQAVDGTFEAVNDAFCQLLGWSKEDLIGHDGMHIVHPDDTGPATPAVKIMMDRQIDWLQADRLLQDPAGHPIPVRVDVTMMRDPDGVPTGCAAVVQDLRPLRESERARLELQQFFDALAERSRDFTTVHDVAGRTIYASPVGRKMFGPVYDQPVEVQANVVHPDDRETTRAAWAHVHEHSDSHTWRFRVRDAEGEWIWVEQTSTNLLDTDVKGIVSTIHDVSSEVAVEQALRTSEARYRAMAEIAEEGIVVISPEGRITYANARFATILGLAHDSIAGLEVWSQLEGGARATVIDRVSTRDERGAERYELSYRHPDGEWRTLWVAASPMPQIDGVSHGSLAMITDITEIRRSADELRHAAQHDHLTGLPNRTTLMRHLDELTFPGAEGTAVLFVDLDHFKDVNDGRGHTAGDMVLIEVAQRLTAAVEPDDLVARFGGDEFVVVLHDVDEHRARHVASVMLAALSRTYGGPHQGIRMGATIGIALSPATSGEHLLRYADTAMYAAKAGGRGRIRVFDQALAAVAEERYVLGAELAAALATDALEMHYQPVVDVATGEVMGVEALARWNHPTRGIIAPERFVALAELNASTGDLDRWVIRRSLRDIGELKADLTMPDDAYVSINLSGQSLSDESLDGYIVDCVEEVGLDPAVVMIEITESAIMIDKDVAIAVLQRLRDRGFAIAIDDFGTGYSSMVYLRDLPITVLKIDRGFISGIPDDAHSLAIVTSLIDIAQSLDLTVVAEGVETQAHLDALRARGCGLAQGWWWSPALSVTQLRSSKILTDRFPGQDVAPEAR
jgi:diguanylate cyclase (GGDEF)-like protein/PAS domain S-box-containing protein